MCARDDKDKELNIKTDKYISDCPYLIKHYIDSILFSKTANTRYIYATYLKHFNNYLMELGIELEQVKPMDIDQYIMYVSKSKDGTNNGFQIINARLSAIISFYDYLVDNDIIAKNPCGKNKKLKVEEKQEVVYLTPEEVNKIKNAIQNGNNRYGKFINRDLALVELGCSVGLRVSAIVNIDIEDIDFEDRSIRVVEKGKTPIKVYFGNNTEKALKIWMYDRYKILKDSNTSALFISKLGSRLSKTAVNDMLKSATKEAGIDKKITAHKMRSTCAMNLYDQTRDIYMVQQQLNHKNIRNTKIYVKATDNQKREAANILDSLY